jgi:hypothetical protein
MPSRTYTVRLKDEDAVLLATDYGSASAGVRAAVAGLVNLLRIEAKPAGPEIPTAAPAKARKVKADPPTPAPKAYKHRDRWCRPCLETGEPRCPACRRAEGV